MLSSRTSFLRCARSSFKSFSTVREPRGCDFGAEHLHPALPRLLSSPIKQGKGSYLELEDGRKILDYTTGIGVCNTGHCHPRVVEAAMEQTQKIIHNQMYMGFSRPVLNLMDRLVDIMPDPSLNCFLFQNSGSEAVENAVKLAKMATGRPNVIVMDGSFHGRTYAASSLTNSKSIYRKGARPEMGGISVTPFPYCFHCDKCESGKSCCMGSAPHITEIFKKQVDANDVAAIMLEPVLGEGGYVVPPADYIRSLRKICDDNGILLILDEVQSGFGRTGKWFAHEHFDDVRADILIMAKGIASGFPLSAIAANRSLMKLQPVGTVGGTYAGNAVACAAACATIDVIQEEGLLQNSLDRGEQLREGLQELKSLKTEIDIRGLGSMNAIEFKGVPYGTVNKITGKCASNGVLLLTTSAYETIRFIPPINTTKEEMGTCLDVFIQATKEIIE